VTVRGVGEHLKDFSNKIQVGRIREHLEEKKESSPLLESINRKLIH